MLLVKKSQLLCSFPVHFKFQYKTTAQCWFSLLHVDIQGSEILKGVSFFLSLNPLFFHSFPVLEHVAHNKDITLIVWDGSLPPGA